MNPATDNPVVLLSADDPAPIEWVNSESDAPLLLLCEHAGNALPSSHDQLGLDPWHLDNHIGWDIGAEAVARLVAHELQAPLLLQRYSRLLIDCNRPPDTTSSIPAVSDGIEIPANQQVSPDEKLARQNEIFKPLDESIQAALGRYQRLAAFSIHSFTPKLQGQPTRPWHAGFLSRSDSTTANTLLQSIKTQRPELTLAINEPYSIDDETDWFIPRYAETQGLSHSMIEIRNDSLVDDAGIHDWAELLTSAIKTVMEGIQ